MYDNQQLIENLCNATAPFNCIGIALIIFKIRKVRSPNNNKSYSKLSIWIYYQLIFGMTMAIAASFVYQHVKEIKHLIPNDTYRRYFWFIFEISFYTQTYVTTLTQIFEWELMILIILEQKGDTIEETMDKWDNKNKIKMFRRKERLLRLTYWVFVVIYTVASFFDQYTYWYSDFNQDSMVIEGIAVFLVIQLAISFLRVRSLFKKFYPIHY